VLLEETPHQARKLLVVSTALFGCLLAELVPTMRLPVITRVVWFGSFACLLDVGQHRRDLRIIEYLGVDVGDRVTDRPCWLTAWKRAASTDTESEIIQTNGATRLIAETQLVGATPGGARVWLRLAATWRTRTRIHWCLGRCSAHIEAGLRQRCDRRCTSRQWCGPSDHLLQRLSRIHHGNGWCHRSTRAKPCRHLAPQSSHAALKRSCTQRPSPRQCRRLGCLHLRLTLCQDRRYVRRGWGDGWDTTSARYCSAQALTLAWVLASREQREHVLSTLCTLRLLRSLTLLTLAWILTSREQRQHVLSTLCTLGLPSSLSAITSLTLGLLRTPVRTRHTQRCSDRLSSPGLSFLG
jgi:hypothetical protein